MSCYAPEWFKRDLKRFPRAHTPEGKPVEEASSLSKNVLEADKRAFCRIMQHLRDHDAQEQTVIMVQVENEIGMIEVPRDYSADATRMYQSAVPQQLTDYLKKYQKSLHPYLKEKLQPKAQAGANWPQLFGDDIYTEEIFQTWTYATYVEQIAKAGRDIYNLPMYVNVALNSRDRKPGQYPSGGPLAHLIDLWHCGAPSIDVLGVDIYDKGIKSWLSKYHLPNNPLFVPEIRLDDKDAMYALYAFGHHGAMGFCPFSIEDYPLTTATNANDWKQMDLSQDDQLNAFSTVGSSRSPLVASYRLLRQAEPLILERQGTKDMDAVLLDNEQREAEIVTPDGIRLTVKHSYTLGWEPGAKDAVWPETACIILRLAKEDYLVIGSGVVVTFSPAESSATWQKGDKRIGLAKCEEVEIVDGRQQIVRHLNGDQTHQGRQATIDHDVGHAVSTKTVRTMQTACHFASGKEPFDRRAVGCHLIHLMILHHHLDNDGPATTLTSAHPLTVLQFLLCRFRTAVVIIRTRSQSHDSHHSDYRNSQKPHILIRYLFVGLRGNACLCNQHFPVEVLEEHHRQRILTLLGKFVLHSSDSGLEEECNQVFV